MVTVNERHYERRRTAAQLAAENPTLADGELAVETDTLGIKVGPGAYTGLPYVTPYRGDVTMQAATISGGTATNGSIRRIQHVKAPWSYTQSTDPTDPAVGTAVLVDAQVTITAGGGFGPQFQTGWFGPRGVYQFEGLVRYGVNMTALGFAPIGYFDGPTIANTAGVARAVVPSWGFCSARSILADGATVTLGDNDTAKGGAGFVDTPVYATVDTGTLNGTTNNHEIISFLSQPGVGGNTAISKRIGFDVQGAVGLGILAGTAHWSGAGTFDSPDTGTIAEEIGLRIQAFTVGASKVGIDSAHMGKFMTAAATNTTATPITAFTIGNGVTFTLQDTGGGLRLGNQWVGLEMVPTIVFEEDGGLLGAFSGYAARPTLKNAAGEARTIPLALSIAAGHTYRGDGALLTVTDHDGFRDDVKTDAVSAGTVSVTTATGFHSMATPSTGGTLVTRRGFRYDDKTGAGAVTNQFAVDIAALSAATAINVGIRNAAPYVATPATQNISGPLQAITPTAEYKELTASTANPTMTAAPTVPDGQNGQILQLVNVDTTDTITLQDQGTLANSNLRLSATTIVLGPRDSITLRFSSVVGDWVQVGQVNVL